MEDILKANKNLNGKIESLQSEVEELREFRERYIRSLEVISGLRTQLNRKETVHVLGKKQGNDNHYALIKTKEEHTSKGIFVEVLM